MRDRTFVVNAISKTENATGWRVGWGISPEAYTPSVRGVNDTLVIQAPTPFQKGAERLLPQDRNHFNSIRKSYAEKCALLTGGLTSAGFSVTPPQGAYYLLADFTKVPGLSNLTSMDAAMHLIREVGVASVPGSNCYHNLSDRDKYLRFAFCRKFDTIAEAVKRLTKIK